MRNYLCVLITLCGLFWVGVEKGKGEALGYIINATSPHDNTYFVHPVKRESIQYLYIDTKYEEDQYSTHFVIDPPRMEVGFCRVEIEIYV